MLSFLALTVLIALAMGAWAFVDTGGKVVFTNFSGLGIENCSLEIRYTTVSAQPHESAYPTTRTQSKQYRINLDGLYDDSAPEHLVALAQADESPAVTYYDANGNALFSGETIWESANDNQRGHDFARHSGSLMSSGQPSVG